jgi:polysaccharide chain length determinant protein (PEP-CTERM system associated)
MEIMEEPSSLGEIFRDYAGMVLRHKWWIIFSVLLGSGIAFAAFQYLPKVYESSTFILVEDQKVPERYVQSATVEDIESQLSTMQQQILSRSLLKKTIEKLGLYKKELKTAGLESVINKMRSSIAITTTGVGSSSVDAFSLSFRGEDPQTAMKVANALASQFMEENLKMREQLVEGTSEFLESELKQMQGVLEEKELKIGEYKRLHMGELPQQSEANLRALDRYESQMQTIRFSRRSLEDRLALLEQTLKVATAQPGLPEAQGSRLPFQSVPPHPLLQKLMERKNLLVHLQGEYKDTYPDIISLKLEITNLEKEWLETQATIQAQLAPPSDETGSLPTVQSIELPFVVDVRRQVAEAQSAIHLLDRQEVDIRGLIVQFEGRVEKTPLREQEMTVLLRDYENIKLNYESLLSKRLSAKLSENLEKKQKGEQFRILDSANLPEKPIQPDPIRFGIGGPLIGLALGVGLAFLREQLHVLIRKPEAVERIMALPVFATIPDFDQEKESAAKKVKQERVLSLKEERG